ncbi:cystathionine beta-lyase [Streptomyces bingchenggensis BCW-1]|uniref:Cystathionine beta-lyase n=1 Tax=Streptomyces bingchenggensis (strain BCW-1) TaxID=749414 RepID=D7C7H7_STRBB|nr:cystathionine beta-lyase [Streptomyces bingchenggensis BCW-1]
MPGNSTVTIHADRDIHPSRAVATPIYQTVVFWAEDPQTFAQVTVGRRAHDFTTRFGNPNHAQVTAVVAELEHTEAAMVTTSGMSALTTAVLALVSAGDHAGRPSLRPWAAPSRGHAHTTPSSASAARWGRGEPVPALQPASPRAPGPCPAASGGHLPRLHVHRVRVDKPVAGVLRGVLGAYHGGAVVGERRRLVVPANAVVVRACGMGHGFCGVQAPRFHAILRPVQVEGPLPRIRGHGSQRVHVGELGDITRGRDCHRAEPARPGSGEADLQPLPVEVADGQLGVPALQQQPASGPVQYLGGVRRCGIEGSCGGGRETGSDLGGTPAKSIVWHRRMPSHSSDGAADLKSSAFGKLLASWPVPVALERRVHAPARAAPAMSTKARKARRLCRVPDSRKFT